MLSLKVKNRLGRIGGSILFAVSILSCENSETLEMSNNAATNRLAMTATDAGAMDGAMDSAASNLVLNGGFDAGADSWWVSGIVPDSLTTSKGELCVGVPGGSVTPWSVMVGQGGVPLEEGVGYTFQFTARATQEVVVKALVGEPNGEYREFSTIHPALSETPQTFSQTFQMGASDYVPQVAFQIGAGDTDWTFCLDNVSVVPLAKENLINGAFDAGMNPWWTDGYLVDWSIASGSFCANVPATEQPWQGLLGQNDIKIEAGTSYTISFYASGDHEAIRAVVQDPSDYSAIGMLTATAAELGETYTATFTAAESVDDAQFMFQLGGADTSWHVCIDDVSLSGGSAVPPYEPETGPGVRVNQVGYLPFASKIATLVTDAAEPLPYSLMNSAGQAVASGETVPFGIDPMSLLHVHTIDFSSWTAEGEGYTLVSDGETSYSFAIGTEGYEKLRYDSLGFFYTMRSGMPIDASIAGEGYGRPAGHAVSPDDGEINQGDVDVPCQPAEDSALYYGEPWTCDYTLDVVGGWYDAGDPGKYVVGGGITVFQLLNAFERGKSAPSSDLGALKDGSLRIPETANGIPDILDEVRYELEFFLKMIVPEGEPLAGMVHHKIHGNEWTQLPLLPNEDSTTRWLHRPSTAATLNVAAVAAQAARIFAPYDKTFATKLLKAARDTWAAALANPALYAPAADGDDGGGAYADSNVEDEFYWAAAELYLTTGEKRFRDYVENSALHTADVFTPDGIIWFDTAALARIDLATVPSALPDREAMKASVIEGATGYLGDQQTNGFGQPYNPPSGVYPWGSNGQVLNNLMVLGAAYDLSGDDAFRQGVLKGIDYILGRNPLNISYVTDFGTVFSHNMHSRWFSHQLDPSLPNPPSGTVSGGPNSQTWTWDPIANRLFGTQGCAPEFCYIDDIESYATNEFAINWNASLAWIASFIADQNTAQGEPVGDCEVSFQTLTKCSKKGTFSALLTLTNTGDATINDWSLSWSFFGDQTIKNALFANIDQEGALVTLTPKNKLKLKPDKSRAFLVNGKLGSLAGPTPGTFFLNGNACTVK